MTFGPTAIAGRTRETTGMNRSRDLKTGKAHGWAGDPQGRGKAALRIAAAPGSSGEPGLQNLADFSLQRPLQNLIDFFSLAVWRISRPARLFFGSLAHRRGGSLTQQAALADPLAEASGPAPLMFGQGDYLTEYTPRVRGMEAASGSSERSACDGRRTDGG